jgi:hypothetical protein
MSRNRREYLTGKKLLYDRCTGFSDLVVVLASAAATHISCAVIGAGHGL